jgi:hypothetical protein
MKLQRIWIEIVLLAAAIACGLALLFAGVGAAASAAVGEVGQNESTPTSEQRTYEGMVTCSRCGAKHAAALGQTATTCVRVCVRDGAHFALVEPDATYVLEGDSIALKLVAGRRARIVGNLTGQTIKVASVAAES